MAFMPESFLSVVPTLIRRAVESRGEVVAFEPVDSEIWLAGSLAFFDAIGDSDTISKNGGAMEYQSLEEHTEHLISEWVCRLDV